VTASSGRRNRAERMAISRRAVVTADNVALVRPRWRQPRC
jgi:hypothetical protein